MFVLGIDPGLSRCGYAVLEPQARHRCRPVAIGVIRTAADQPVAVRLAELRHELGLLFDDYRPSVLALERVFAQRNLRTVVGVAQASGLAMAEAAGRGAAVAEYSPSAVKAAVTGDGRADKLQVQTMVQMLLGLVEPPRPADAADAAAVALCHLAHAPAARARSRAMGAG
ncbi:MAG: crossover junction endodeoxyribonuclease RuvC [Acidimicrobiales bacterium]